MRIALVYRSFNLSGSLARKTVELARHLSSRHDVHVFSTAVRTDASLAPACTFHDVPVAALSDGVRFSARDLLTFAPRAARRVDVEQFDIVHVCNPSTWIGDVLHLPGVARGEAEIRGYSHARFVASNLRHAGNAARWIVEQRALRNPALARIHVDAPSVLTDLKRFYGLPDERVLLVPPAVNLAEFGPAENPAAARASVLVHDATRIVLLFCGSAFYRKGLDRAIEALASTDVDAELLVVGHSHEEERFRALAHARGISDRVRFLGSRSDAARFYQASDILLLPTRGDVWGITPIEAMACGMPAIVTTAAGSASVVGGAGAGLVLPEPLTVNRLREAIEHLARRPELRREMGRRGLAAAPAHSWETRGRLVEDDLLAVAEEKSSERRRSARHL